MFGTAECHSTRVATRGWTTADRKEAVAAFIANANPVAFRIQKVIQNEGEERGVPSVMQYRNLKGNMNLKKSNDATGNGLAINDIRNLCLSRRMPLEDDEYEGISPNKMFVTTTFDSQYTTSDGVVWPSMGWNMSSKKCIENMQEVYRCHREKGIVLMIDGTYKLFFLGWVLFVVGATVVVFESNGESHLTFRPFMLQVTRTEDQFACREVLKALRYLAINKGGIDFMVKVKAVHLDHCAASVAGVEKELEEGVVHYQCSVHLKKAMTDAKHTALLVEKDAVDWIKKVFKVHSMSIL